MNVAFKQEFYYLQDFIKFKNWLKTNRCQKTLSYLIIWSIQAEAWEIPTAKVGTVGFNKIQRNIVMVPFLRKYIQTKVYNNTQIIASHEFYLKYIVLIFLVLLQQIAQLKINQKPSQIK
jgi:hypothetical protein